MTKHTPGPWSAIGADVKTAGPLSRVICWTGTASDIALDEIRANARLIAAAPDMAQTIRDLLALHIAHHNHPHHARAREILRAINGE